MIEHIVCVDIKCPESQVICVELYARLSLNLIPSRETMRILIHKLHAVTVSIRTEV